MRKLATKFFPSVRDETFFESAGVADLITTCFGGRNRKCAEAYVKSWKANKPRTWEEIEKKELNGQKLQGVMTSDEVQEILRRNDLEASYPLFTTINRICRGDLTPDYIIRYFEIPGSETMSNALDTMVV
jgi:glycerol-3-phosphate dehydrogenase (NAD+)